MKMDAPLFSHWQNSGFLMPQLICLLHPLDIYIQRNQFNFAYTDEGWVHLTGELFLNDVQIFMTYRIATHAHF